MPSGAHIVSASVLVLLTTLLPCCGGAAPEAAGNVTSPIGLSPESFPEQVTVGKRLFAETCASCHGDSGQGNGDAPALVGLDRGALPLEPPALRKFRRLRFETVGDVADFVVRTMPLNAPGRLSDEQYFSVLAFDLKANGIDLGKKKLDAALAASLEIPRN